MSLELKAEWIDSGLAALEKEAEKRFTGDELAVARQGVAKLRSVRDPMARLGQAPVRGALELVGFGQGVTDGELRALFQRAQLAGFDARRQAEAMTHAEAVAAKDQHDEDVRKLLDALKDVAKFVLPLLLAAL